MGVAECLVEIEMGDIIPWGKRPTWAFILALPTYTYNTERKNLVELYSKEYNYMCVCVWGGGGGEDPTQG